MLAFPNAFCDIVALVFVGTRDAGLTGGVDPSAGEKGGEDFSFEALEPLLVAVGLEVGFNVI
jgi:hypothetical protein